MKHELTENGNCNLLSLSGEIDLHYSSDLRELILEACNKARPFHIDLKNVTYIDSSGIACFVEGYQLSKKNNIEFFLVNISPPVMKVIKLARLDSVFPIK